MHHYLQIVKADMPTCQMEPFEENLQISMLKTLIVPRAPFQIKEGVPGLEYGISSWHISAGVCVSALCRIWRLAHLSLHARPRDT